MTFKSVSVVKLLVPIRKVGQAGGWSIGQCCGAGRKNPHIRKLEMGQHARWMWKAAKKKWTCKSAWMRQAGFQLAGTMTRSIAVSEDVETGDIVQQRGHTARESKGKVNGVGEEDDELTAGEGDGNGDVGEGVIEPPDWRLRAVPEAHTPKRSEKGTKRHLYHSVIGAHTA